MTINFSDHGKEKYFSNDIIQEKLELRKSQFLDGNKKALFDAIALCARFQAVMPEWVVDAITGSEERLYHGEIQNFSEIFGSPFDSAKDRNLSKLIKYENTVLHLLQLHRVHGGSLNYEEGLETVAEKMSELVGEKFTRAKVEKIYNKYKGNIKSLPRSTPFNVIHGSTNIFEQIKDPTNWPRRSGRKLFEDNKS